MPPVRLEFVYDYMSRRCVKRLYDKSGEAAAAVGGSAIVEGSAAAVVQSDEEPVAPESGGVVVIPVGWSLKSTFKFVWDGWNLLAELDGDDGVLRACAWGLDLSGSEQGAGGVGGLVFQYLSKPDTTFHLYYDGNGNVTSLRDDGGTLSCEYAYGPFGETLTARGDEAALVYNAFKFSTKYADAESGLLYYGYRYYNPGTGRWLTRDPVGEGGGIPILAFAANQPVSHIDVLGLRPWLATFSGINSNRDYLAAALRARGMNVDYSWHSSLGTTAAYESTGNRIGPWGDWRSQSRLNREADEESRTHFGFGAACKDCQSHESPSKSTFHVFMLSPKTHRRPPTSSCCDVTIDVLWSPFDRVPNQGPFGEEESVGYWSQWGKVHVVDTLYYTQREDPNPMRDVLNDEPFPNHALAPFLLRVPRLVPNTAPPVVAPPSGPGGTATVQHNPWMRDGWISGSAMIQNALGSGVEHVWVCHSQGCNMAMYSLNRICGDSSALPVQRPRPIEVIWP